MHVLFKFKKEKNKKNFKQSIDLATYQMLCPPKLLGSLGDTLTTMTVHDGGAGGDVWRSYEDGFPSEGDGMVRDLEVHSNQWRP